MNELFVAVTLALAWFALVNFTASVTVSVAARAVDSRCITRQPGRAARILLALRVAPAAASVLFTAGIFAPGHWRWEPAGIQESLGYSVLVLGAAGAAVIVATIARAIRRTRALRTMVDRWRRSAVPARSGRISPELPVLLLRVPAPVMALAGTRRPELYVADAVAQALDTDELAIAIAHEAAHACANDNLKRLIALWCPDLLGTSGLGRGIAARWNAAVELAADAHAVSGDQRRAVTLASALLKIARLRLQPATAALAISGIHHQGLLAARIERLLSDPPVDVRVTPPLSPRAAGGHWRVVAAGAAVTATIVICHALPVWWTVHEATEVLVRVLP